MVPAAAPPSPAASLSSSRTFLLALLQACKASEIHTALDTSGFASWDVLDRVRPFVDLFLYDLKLMDPGRHRKFTGAFNTRILDNLQRLARLGHNIIVRIPADTRRK